MGSVVGTINEETPNYQVLQKINDDNTEIRAYEPMLLVETPMEKEGDKAFSTLASYIGVFGNAQNQEGDAIPMTAPVLTQNNTNNSGFYSFTSFPS